MDLAWEAHAEAGRCKDTIRTRWTDLTYDDRVALQRRARLMKDVKAHYTNLARSVMVSGR
jgi:hypothetical protein